MSPNLGAFAILPLDVLQLLLRQYLIDDICAVRSLNKTFRMCAILMRLHAGKLSKVRLYIARCLANGREVGKLADSINKFAEGDTSIDLKEIHQRDMCVTPRSTPVIKMMFESKEYASIYAWIIRDHYDLAISVLMEASESARMYFLKYYFDEKVYKSVDSEKLKVQKILCDEALLHLYISGIIDIDNDKLIIMTSSHRYAEIFARAGGGVHKRMIAAAKNSSSYITGFAPYDYISRYILDICDILRIKPLLNLDLFGIGADEVVEMLPCLRVWDSPDIKPLAKFPTYNIRLHHEIFAAAYPSATLEETMKYCILDTISPNIIIKMIHAGMFIPDDMYLSIRGINTTDADKILRELYYY